MNIGANFYTPHHQITSDCSKGESDDWMEKIRYPEWLTTDMNSYQIFERNGKRIQSPKQVRFDGEEKIHSYPYLNTTIRQLKTETMTTISNNDTFI